MEVCKKDGQMAGCLPEREQSVADAWDRPECKVARPDAGSGFGATELGVNPPIGVTGYGSKRGGPCRYFVFDRNQVVKFSK